MKRGKIVIVSYYMSGIYPPGHDDVVFHLLATGYLKAAIDADKNLSSKYETVILDFTTNTKDEEVIKQVIEHDPKVVLYSTYIWNHEYAFRNSKLLRQLRPDTHIIFGGPQVSYNAEEVLRDNPQCDIIVRGDNISVIKMVLDSDFSHKDISKIPNLTYMNGGKVISSPGFMKDDLSLISSPYQTGAFNLNDGKKHTVTIEMSRGCVFRCQYCVWGDRNVQMNKFPLDRLLKDVEIIYNNPNIEVVYFLDSCIFYMPDYAKQIIDKITTCKYKDIPTVLSLDPRVLNEEMIKYLQKIKRMHNQYQFGLQAVNAETLKTANRYFLVDRFKEKIDLLRKVDTNAEIGLDIIFGLPGDNYETFRDTIDFALKIRASKIYPSPLLLLPGTPYFHDRDNYKFVADEKTWMVKSNNTYSEEDMQKTRRFILWVLGIMYYPAIREVIARACELNPNFRRINLIDKLIEIIKGRINPEEWITIEYNLESVNLNRRIFMNFLSKPENSLIVYESALELLKYYNFEELSKDIEDGIDYYTKICKGVGEEDSPIFDHLDIAAIKNIKYKWVVSSVTDV